MSENTRPSDQELARISDDKRFFLAVSNYMANVLGVDRAYLAEPIDEKLSQRNIEQAILERVQRYFRVGVNGMSADRVARDKIDQLITNYVTKELQNGAAGEIDRMVQNQIARIAAAITPEQDDPEPAYRPMPGGSRVYDQVVWLDRETIRSWIRKWLAEAFPGREPMPFAIWLRPAAGNDISVSFELQDATDEDQFRPYMTSGRSSSRKAGPALELVLRDQDAAALLAGIAHINLARMLADDQGVALIPKQAICPAATPGPDAYSSHAMDGYLPDDLIDWLNERHIYAPSDLIQMSDQQLALLPGVTPDKADTLANARHRMIRHMGVTVHDQMFRGAKT